MLPLSLLKTAQNHPMLVELKNGETYNGHLVCCDSWMNINLREVICTSRDGDKFWRMAECYIRGITIKYIRIPDEVIDMMKDDMVMKNRARGDSRPGRGNMGARGRNTPRDFPMENLLIAIDRKFDFGGGGSLGGRGKAAIGNVRHAPYMKNKDS